MLISKSPTAASVVLIYTLSEAAGYVLCFPYQQDLMWKLVV